ncbi:MAG: glycoside hydrolase family 66 protein [Nostocoides sp.]
MTAAALDARSARGSHSPTTPVVLLVDAPADAEVTVEVRRLATLVSTRSFAGSTGRNALTLGVFETGAYAVHVRSGDSVATTAFDVLADANARPRYGFVTDFRPGRADAEAVADSFRAFHLTHIQFYDWMYRHAVLLPPTDEFVDTLGRDLSLPVVRDFVRATHDAGAQALAYAAVYAAGTAWAAEHPEQLVSHPDRSPWMLGDFLWNTDLRPGSAWSRHLVAEMGAAVDEVGFDGLHLDQYGDPKHATASDGEVVDYAEAFPAYIDAVRTRLPRSTLIFNNVNDYPTWATVRASQDATYIEVWSPHDTHADLVDLVRRARALAPDRPVILAAYLEPFAVASGPAEVSAAKLALATVWAEGGQYLLFGEQDGALVHPYYPNYATLETAAVDTLRQFVDFAVAAGDLLFDPSVQEGTTHLCGGINQDVAVEGVPSSLRPEAGRVFVRVSTAGRRLVVQLVDHRTQDDNRWNVPRQETGTCSGIRLRVKIASRSPSAVVGHPLGGPAFERVGLRMEGEYAVVDVPEFDTWAIVVVDR